MSKLLEEYNLLTFTQEEIENLNSLITFKKMKQLKFFAQRNFDLQIIPVLHKPFQRVEMEGNTPQLIL